MNTSFSSGTTFSTDTSSLTDGSLTDSSSLRRGAAAAAIAGAGLLHAFITLEYIKEKAYIGVLFGLSVPLCLGVAAWLVARNDRRAWIAGGLLCAGMVAGFLASRTIGLPGFDESGVWEHWKEGFPALAAELGFLGLAVRPMFARTPDTTWAPPAAADHRDLVSR